MSASKAEIRATLKMILSECLQNRLRKVDCTEVDGSLNNLHHFEYLQSVISGNTLFRKKCPQSYGPGPSIYDCDLDGREEGAPQSFCFNIHDFSCFIEQRNWISWLILSTCKRGFDIICKNPLCINESRGNFWRCVISIRCPLYIQWQGFLNCICTVQDQSVT